MGKEKPEVHVDVTYDEHPSVVLTEKIGHKKYKHTRVAARYECLCGNIVTREDWRTYRQTVEHRNKPLGGRCKVCAHREYNAQYKKSIGKEEYNKRVSRSHHRTGYYKRHAKREQEKYKKNPALHEKKKAYLKERYHANKKDAIVEGEI